MKPKCGNHCGVTGSNTLPTPAPASTALRGIPRGYGIKYDDVINPHIAVNSSN
jgi:hypothetical protein